MEINRENYAKSLENIKASDKFLAETKELMLKESAKSKTASRPVIMKITPFAAAAACIAVIAALSVNILKDNSVSTVQKKSSPTIETAAAAEEEHSEAADEIADEAADEAVPDEETTTQTTAETTENEPFVFAVNSDTTSTDETTESVSNEPSAETESNDENTPADDSPAADDDDTDSSSESSEDSGSESGEDTSENDCSTEDSDDDVETDDEDEDPESDSPVAPAFTSLSGGRALYYPDFSPTDTEKLIEFLSLAAQDDINAEITLEGQNSYDIFGEKAAALNDAFAEAAEKLVPINTENFAPTLSFSVFDNLSGDLLYTVQTDGSTVSVRIKNGETFCFSADNATVQTIISAAE